MPIDLNIALAKAAESGHLDEIKRLLEAGADPKHNASEVLQWAAESGHLEIVKLLLPVSDPRASDSLALRWAAENGHLEIVKLLLPHSDHAKALKGPDFVRSQGCDVLLSCLPSSLAKQFMIDNPSLDLPRTRAMLASLALSARGTTAKQAVCKRLRKRA